MYLYSFSHYAGFDKVFFIDNPDFKYKLGDLIQQDQQYFLVLGEKISFQELYTTVYSGNTFFSLVYPMFLSKSTIQLLHRMVYEWYTTYKNVIKLFLDTDIDKHLLKASKPNKKNQNIDFQLGKLRIQNEGGGQILVIFPDLWSFSNLVNLESSGGILLSSIDTQSRKNSNWRKIKTGNEKLIFCTGSEIFQDFAKLEKIFIIEPQKRYYANQQDPRYKIEKVAEQMAKCYGSELVSIASEDLFSTP